MINPQDFSHPVSAICELVRAFEDAHRASTTPPVLLPDSPIVTHPPFPDPQWFSVHFTLVPNAFLRVRVPHAKPLTVDLVDAFQIGAVRFDEAARELLRVDCNFGVMIKDWSRHLDVVVAYLRCWVRGL